MGQGNAKPEAAVNNVVDDNNEVERIMKEIEDLEQDLNTIPETPSDAAASVASEMASLNEAAQKESVDDMTTDTTEEVEPTQDNVVRLKPKSGFDAAFEENAVSDSTEEATDGGNLDGNLSLKVGGLTSVHLEFEKAGITVCFECTDTALIIKTDQGAEFKVPFNSTNYARKAA